MRLRHKGLLRSVWPLVMSLAACTMQSSRESGAVRVPKDSVSERTVFTDSALYRQHCLEADSGLTAASRRCTPRDQNFRKVP